MPISFAARDRRPRISPRALARIAASLQTRFLQAPEGEEMKNAGRRAATLHSFRALLFFAVLFAAALGCAPESSAGNLSTAVIGMFPKQIGEFAYADLKSARKFPWFTQFRDQVLPGRFREFEKFLASAGVDPDTQVDE